MTGIEARTGPFTGSAWLEIDFGLPAVPLANVPNRQGPIRTTAPGACPSSTR